MTKPRLLVLATELPKSLNPIKLEEALALLFESELGGVEVRGYCALPYSPESLLDWAVLGKNTKQNEFLQGVQKGCELYVGIRTPEDELLYCGERTKDGKFDRYQFGERGFDLAIKKGIPAILLNKYDMHEICDFVNRQTR